MKCLVIQEQGPSGRLPGPATQGMMTSVDSVVIGISDTTSSTQTNSSTSKRTANVPSSNNNSSTKVTFMVSASGNNSEAIRMVTSKTQRRTPSTIRTRRTITERRLIPMAGVISTHSTTLATSQGSMTILDSTSHGEVDAGNIHSNNLSSTCVTCMRGSRLRHAKSRSTGETRMSIDVSRLRNIANG